MNFNFHADPTFPNYGKRSLKDSKENMVKKKGKITPKNMAKFYCGINLEKTQNST